MVALPDGEASGFTKERRANLILLARKFKGRITPVKMMAILDTTIPNKGATFPEEGNVRTHYQIIAAPQDLKLWLKVRNVQNWTELDLKPLFHGENGTK